MSNRILERRCPPDDPDTACPVRIALLDSHPTMSQLLAEALAQESGLQLQGAWTDSHDLFAGLARVPVDMVLIEYVLSSHDLGSDQIINQVRQCHPQVRILVISTNESQLITATAMQAGAHGYLHRSADWSTLIETIMRLTTTPSGRIHDTCRAPSVVLSPRERIVLRHSLAGAGVSGLAREQGLSEKTISTQKRSAYRKLGLLGDTDLFRLANLVAPLVRETSSTPEPQTA